MAKRWTDAEFIVVSGPRRIGDPHPKRRRWRYAGLTGYGAVQWYRPARFNRLQVFGLLCLGVVIARVIFYAGLWLLHRH